MSELIILKPTAPHHVPAVEFKQLKQQYDKEPCLRIYTTMGTSAFLLQVRATTPLQSDGSKRKELMDRNLIASISLNLDDLKQIAEYVKKMEP